MPEKVVTLPEIASSEYVSSSRCIHKGPCIVKAVHMTYTGEATGECKVYDGVNEKGKLKALLIAGDFGSYTWRPGDGTDFDYGIYVELEDKITVTVTYIPESRKAFI